MTDPIRLWRRWTALAISAGLAAGLGVGIWAFAPLTNPVPNFEPARGPSEAVTADAEALPDPALFAVALWNPPRTPPMEDPRPEPSEDLVRIEYQLIAIAHDDSQRQAILYDPTSDKLRTVGGGAQLGDITVDEVTPSGVTLSRDGRQVTLELRPKTRE